MILEAGLANHGRNLASVVRRHGDVVFVSLVVLENRGVDQAKAVILNLGVNDNLVAVCVKENGGLLVIFVLSKLNTVPIVGMGVSLEAGVVLNVGPGRVLVRFRGEVVLDCFRNSHCRKHSKKSDRSHLIIIIMGIY